VIAASRLTDGSSRDIPWLELEPSLMPRLVAVIVPLQRMDIVFDFQSRGYGADVVDGAFQGSDDGTDNRGLSSSTGISTSIRKHRIVVTPKLRSSP